MRQGAPFTVNTIIMLSFRLCALLRAPPCARSRPFASAAALPPSVPWMM
jgi:hypothetical protein